jgi:hypothetical protein
MFYVVVLCKLSDVEVVAMGERLLLVVLAERACALRLGVLGWIRRDEGQGQARRESSI